MSTTRTFSASTRKRGRGKTAIARKRSRAAFTAWDTRRENERAEKRRKAARKAVQTRKRNAAKIT